MENMKNNMQKNMHKKEIIHKIHKEENMIRKEEYEEG